MLSYHTALTFRCCGRWLTEFEGRVTQRDLRERRNFDARLYNIVQLSEEGSFAV